VSQNPYIGQAQISTQVEHEGYAIGDLVVWKSAQNKDKTTRYLVEGFKGDRAILRCLDDETWLPIAEWFVKADETERQHDEVVDVLTQIVSSNVSESSDTVTITISREDAEGWVSDADHIHANAWIPVDKAIRAALEGER
jgi:hypothetical protein